MFGLSRIFRKKEQQLYIHIGPGKTGTSVIQKWCLDNREYIKQKGIYYPPHGIDNNGISSGHQSVLLSEKKGEWFLDKKKVSLFRTYIKSKKASLVLLSSERFWMHIEELALEFPDAIFIFYIRSPLEFFESGYNQRVKRHFETKKIKSRFRIFKGIPYGSNALLKAIDRFGRKRFIVRLFDRSSFLEGNVLHDFMPILGVDEFPNVISKDVNSAYCIEALEFKRLVNRCKIDVLNDVKLDQLLQICPSENYKYSLLPPKTFKTFKLKVIENMTLLLNQLNIESDERDQFLGSIEKQAQKKYRKQSLSEDDKNKVLSYLETNDRKLTKIIKDKLQQFSSSKG